MPQVCLYNPQNQTFMTATASDVKQWDAATGQVMRNYAAVSDSAISAMCLDRRARRFVIGTHSGEVTARDYALGSVEVDCPRDLKCSFAGGHRGRGSSP